MQKAHFVEAMRTAAGDQHHTLSEYLQRTGIQPGPFAFFLSQYIKRKPKKKRSVLALLLSAQLVAQAELITYHLKH